MSYFIVPTLLGVFIVILGILNMKGNLSSLHWYHRQRVSEEDRLPFGKTVGLGTVIIGAALIFFGALSLASELFDVAWLTLVGSVVMIIGIVSGLGLSFWAMIKYNKGIF